MLEDFPHSPEAVLNIIVHAERHRKFVWTSGRVLKEAALWTQVENLGHRERKSALMEVLRFLEDLEARGILQRRRELQSIGYGSEIGFDFVRDAASANEASSTRDC